MKQWSQVNVSLLLAIVVAIDAVGLDEIRVLPQLEQVPRRLRKLLRMSVLVC